MGRRGLVFIARLLLLLVLLAARSANADEIAPDLEAADLRVRAQLELKRRVAALDVAEQRRLAGVYVAFDPSVSQPAAQIACDDDGDYVIVLSDALLRLLTHVARATSYDETNGTKKLDEYAAFLAHTQPPGRRLLPPPPGFFVAARDGATHDERFAEMLAFVVLTELARLRAGDVICPHPTATRERGDDTWTSAERLAAESVATRAYPAAQPARDDDALGRVDARGAESALALLRFFSAHETESRRPVFAYEVLHSNGAARLADAKRALDARGAQLR